jgi:hypothetical protein
MKSRDVLCSIIGEHLSSIEFIHDYLQLHFQDKTCTCYIWPKIIFSGLEITKRDIDYKNKLCNFIGKIVLDVYMAEKIELSFIFTDGNKITISLDPNNPEIVSEIAILSDQENNWSVFE